MNGIPVAPADAALLRVTEGHEDEAWFELEAARVLRDFACDGVCSHLGCADARERAARYTRTANRLRALAVEMEEREQQRDAFFTAFTALPCRICGGKRNWQTDGQLQAVCHDCAHRTRAREGR